MYKRQVEIIASRFLWKMKADFCTVYVAKKNVIYTFDKQYEAYADRYIKMVSEVKYPNREMEQDVYKRQEYACHIRTCALVRRNRGKEMPYHRPQKRGDGAYSV